MKTVTEADVWAFAEITGDYNPLHFDEEFAASTRFGGSLRKAGWRPGSSMRWLPWTFPGQAPYS